MARKKHASRPIQLFLVDDAPLVRSGLRLLINSEPDLEVCGEAGTQRDGVEGILTRRPDVAIVDLSLREGDGLA